MSLLKFKILRPVQVQIIDLEQSATISKQSKKIKKTKSVKRKTRINSFQRALDIASEQINDLTIVDNVPPQPKKIIEISDEEQDVFVISKPDEESLFKTTLQEFMTMVAESPKPPKFVNIPDWTEQIKICKEMVNAEDLPDADLVKRTKKKEIEEFENRSQIIQAQMDSQIASLVSQFTKHFWKFITGPDGFETREFVLSALNLDSLKFACYLANWENYISNHEQLCFLLQAHGPTNRNCVALKMILEEYLSNYSFGWKSRNSKTLKESKKKSEEILKLQERVKMLEDKLKNNNIDIE